MTMQEIYLYVRPMTYAQEIYTYDQKPMTKRYKRMSKDLWSRYQYMIHITLMLWVAAYRQGGSHAEVAARSIPGWAETAPIYTMFGYCPWGWGVRPVNWINRLWRHCRSSLWSSATRSSPLGYFSRFLQVVDNCHRILWDLIIHW